MRCICDTFCACLFLESWLQRVSKVALRWPSQRYLSWLFTVGSPHIPWRTYPMPGIGIGVCCCACLHLSDGMWHELVCWRISYQLPLNLRSVLCNGFQSHSQSTLISQALRVRFNLMWMYFCNVNGGFSTSSRCQPNAVINCWSCVATNHFPCSSTSSTRYVAILSL